MGKMFQSNQATAIFVHSPAVALVIIGGIRNFIALQYSHHFTATFSN